MDEKLLLDQRLNHIETMMSEQLYPMTRGMLGPGILLHPDAHFPVSFCKEYFDARDKGIRLDMKQIIDNPTISSRSFNWVSEATRRVFVEKCINIFYESKNYFTKERIIPSKNQFIVNGIIRGGENIAKNLTCHTVYTRRFNDDVIGVIVRSKTYFTIHMAMYPDPTFKIINKTIKLSDGRTITKTCCTEKDFLDYKYICILPFDVDSGMLNSNGRWVLIQNNKLYPYDIHDLMIDDHISVITNDRGIDYGILFGVPY